MTQNTIYRMKYRSFKRRKSKPHLLLTKQAIADVLGLHWRTIHRDFVKLDISVTDLLAVSQYICHRLTCSAEKVKAKNAS